MAFYINGELYSNSNDLNNLLSAVEKLSLHDRLYFRPFYVDCNRYYTISGNDGIYEYDPDYGGIPSKVEQNDILLIVKDSQNEKTGVICVTKDTTESSILGFLSKTPEGKIEVIIVGDTNIKNQFCADRNNNILKALNALTHYQHGDIIINNSYIYNNVNNRKLIKVDRDSLDNEELSELGESKTLSKRPFICGSSTTLVFLVVAAALHLFSSNFVAQIIPLVFAAASIPAGLTVGLAMHYYMRPNQKLEDMKTSKSTPEQQIVES